MGGEPYYVYELIDPRDGKPFYVGKGVRDRVHQHEKDAKTGASLGRFDRIKEIWAAGLEIEKHIVAWFGDEKEAYAAESARISEIGLENLTNRTPGAGFDPDASHDREWLKALAVVGVKTGWFTEVRAWLYGQKWHPLPACALISFRNQWDGLCLKRGTPWVTEHCSAMRINVAGPRAV